jgi:cytochrome c oxidase subunit 3
MPLDTDAAADLALAHHFPDLAKQAHAARLGMWLFLATEILLFAGLFTGYGLYRFLFYDTFQAASRSMETGLGTLNTFVLITSSLTVALALHFVQHGRRVAGVVCLVVTLVFALAFLGIKAIEYTHHFQEGQLPGQYYHYAAVQGPGVTLFFTLYFLMTGLHGIHVLVGMGVLAVVAVRTWQGAYGPRYHTPLELGAMYWHLVDLIWIFIYPLLYLI